jgi:hypothetical protein
MYVFVRDIGFSSLYDFVLDFGELFRQWTFLCFSFYRIYRTEVNCHFLIISR